MMLTIRLLKAEWAKAWRTMIEVAPVRLIGDDPVYEVLPVHLEVLTARGFTYEVVPTQSAPGGETAPWHGRLEASKYTCRWITTMAGPSRSRSTSPSSRSC